MECRLGKKWTAHTLSGAMLAVLAALALIGAGCGNNHPTGPKGGGGSSFINSANEAWVFCEDEYEYGEYCNGYIFRSDSSFQIIQKSGDHWFQTHSSTYIIDSTDIIFDGETASFTVSGNTLTLNFGYKVEQRTRTQVSILANPRTGGSLVLGEGQAWTYNDGPWDEGYIFRSDSTFINIGRYKGGVWENEAEGTYTISGGNITLTHAWGPESGTYTVTGNTLILTVDEGAYKYTEIFAVTNNVIIDDSGTTTCSNPPIELTENVWAYDSLTLSGCDFLYSFNVVGGQTYFVSLDDKYSGPKIGTADVAITGTYSEGAIILYVDDRPGPAVFTANRTGTIYIRVDLLDGVSGTFGVMWTRTNPTGGEIDVRLVNNPNEAWVDHYTPGNRDGFILHANGTYTAVTDATDNGLWTHDGSGTWHTTGNVLTLSGDGYYVDHIGSGNYTVSGNTLEWGGFGGETFIKASGVIISSYASMSPPDYAENPLRKQKLASLSKKPSPQKQTSLSKQPSMPKKPSARKKPTWPGKFSSSK